jgi:hypothetical protein
MVLKKAKRKKLNAERETQVSTLSLLLISCILR